MGRYILKRLLWIIPVVLGVTILIFVLMHFVPGDPATIILGSEATEADLIAKREQLGLTRPLWQQILNYMERVFLSRILFDGGETASASGLIRDAVSQGMALAIGFSDRLGTE